MPDATQPELDILDAIYAALRRIDGSGPYNHALTVVVPFESSNVLEAGDPPIAAVADPQVRTVRPGSALNGENYTLTTQIAMVVPAGGETQRDRVRSSMQALSDVRTAILARSTGAWLDLPPEVCVVNLRLLDFEAQPEETASAWYGVVRGTVEVGYHVRFPTREDQA